MWPTWTWTEVRPRSLAVSTLEHVGLDEETPDPDKPARAIARLKALLKPGGLLWVTLPVGYNTELDRQIRAGELGFTRLRALVARTRATAGERCRSEQVWRPATTGCSTRRTGWSSREYVAAPWPRPGSLRDPGPSLRSRHLRQTACLGVACATLRRGDSHGGLRRVGGTRCVSRWVRSCWGWGPSCSSSRCWRSVGPWGGEEDPDRRQLHDEPQRRGPASRRVDRRAGAPVPITIQSITQADSDKSDDDVVVFVSGSCVVENDDGQSPPASTVKTPAWSPRTRAPSPPTG